MQVLKERDFWESGSFLVNMAGVTKVQSQTPPQRAAVGWNILV